MSVVVRTLVPRVAKACCSALLSTILTACAATPPTGWLAGGQPVVLPRARWINGDVLVDVEPDGKVIVNQRHLLSVDATGRVYDAYNRPVALLQPDGMLIGGNDSPMGWVGAGEAILPGDDHSWLRLESGGLLIQNDGDEEKPFGQWLGCDRPQVLQLCTLVSHIVGRELRARTGSGGGFGLGSGVTMGVGTFLTP